MLENPCLQCLRRPRSLHLPASPIHSVVAVVIVKGVRRERRVRMVREVRLFIFGFPVA